MMSKAIKPRLVIVGGGLAGCEAAYQAAERGISVILYEMRPLVSTGAHVTSFLAELVCSNSFGSNLRGKASGLLIEELRILGSVLLKCAEKTSIPAGGALAVDREAFAHLVSDIISGHPRITLIREEVEDVPPELSIVASGPLTSPSLSNSLVKLTGQEHLFFYDAISPIVRKETIDLEVAYRASRYDKGTNRAGDYINCPLSKKQYNEFVESLVSARRIELREFEQDLNRGVDAGTHEFFEGCLPVEVLAKRGPQTLAYGPLRPVGLTDPRTGKRPYAVVQLRQDNLADTLYNMVGFQTNLTFAEQRRIFRMIPGLANAEFERYGQMHRNTFIFSPALLLPTMQYRKRSDLFFAGQITGIEGYMGNIASGLVAGLNAASFAYGEELVELPRATMIGALCHYITHTSPEDFQPMKANFGLLPPICEVDRVKMGKKQRGLAYAERSLRILNEFISKKHLETCA